jgi:aerobic C4-dicarboxylate transport protein
MKRLASNLTFWVLTAIVSGILLGHFYPKVAMQEVISAPFKTHLLGQEIKIGTTLSEVLGTSFISIVKLFINPIIFTTITLGIVAMGDLKKVGKIGVKALFYFEVVTTLAILIGVAVSSILKPGQGVITKAESKEEVAKFTQRAMEFNWWQFFKENSTIQVLIVSILLGTLLSKLEKKTAILNMLQRFSKILFSILHKVMYLAPIGAFGGMAFTIAKYGLKALIPLAKLMITVYCTMAIFIFIILMYILKYYRVSLLKFLNYIKQELLIVLGTSSSEAALPNLMKKLEDMGCAKSLVGLVVPTGYSFNLDGTSIYLSMAVLFLAQVYQVDLTMSQILTIIGILMVTSKGAAGVTGSGFVVLASTLTALNGVIPIEGLALLLGVDRFMSEARSITNFIGNGVATIWIAHNEKVFDRNKMEEAFNAARS